MSVEVSSSSLKPRAWGLKPDFEPLDIAACYGTGFTAKAISYATASVLAPSRLRIGPSHVATFCEYQQRMVWIESTTLCPHPCDITGRKINGCQAHDPASRIRTTSPMADESICIDSPPSRNSPAMSGICSAGFSSGTSSGARSRMTSAGRCCPGRGCSNGPGCFRQQTSTSCSARSWSLRCACDWVG